MSMQCAFDIGDYSDFTGYVNFHGTEALVEHAYFKLCRTPLDYCVMDWESGTWIDGVKKGGDWHDGTWKNGTFKNGRWYGGTWHEGVFTNSSWFRGEFNGGVFENSVWWHGGKWHGGRWIRSSYIDRDWHEYRLLNHTRWKRIAMKENLDS